MWHPYKTRRWIIIFVMACALGLAGAGASAAPAIWKASDDDSVIYLFGSFHLLPADARWLTDDLRHVIETADLFYYEIPMGPATQAKVGTLTMQYGMNAPGVTLTSYLDASQIEHLKRVIEELGVPLRLLQPMQPWLASLTLTALFAIKSGYLPDSGVEHNLEPLTPDASERHLETAAQQIRMLAELPAEVAVTGLVATLHQIGRQPRLLDRMADAWQAGDVARLDRLVNREMRQAGPGYYRTLIVERNKRWAEQILALMAGSKDALITVGSAHLVGADSVQSLLRARGITVERVQ